MNTETRNEKINAIRENIGKVLVGKEKLTDLILTAIIAEGHILLEDVPGSGKTVMAKSLARSIDAEFSRIQFTPDLLPSDVTGLNYYNQKEGEFTFREGPVFCNILLADEINRATPRTQSALLECMEERQVTVDGVTYPLDRPFFCYCDSEPGRDFRNLSSSGSTAGPFPDAALHGTSKCSGGMCHYGAFPDVQSSDRTWLRLYGRRTHRASKRLSGYPYSSDAD